MSEAWGLVKGMKASFWGAAIVIGHHLPGRRTRSPASSWVRCSTSLPRAWPVRSYKAVFNMIVGGLLAPLTLGLE
jgi:hypothetical protein